MYIKNMTKLNFIYNIHMYMYVWNLNFEEAKTNKKYIEKKMRHF